MGKYLWSPSSKGFFFSIPEENIIQRELYIVAKLGDNLKSIGTRCFKKETKMKSYQLKIKTKCTFLTSAIPKFLIFYSAIVPWHALGLMVDY